MNKTAKVLLSGCLGVIVIGVLVLVLAWRFVASHKDEWMSKGKVMEAEGRTAGASLDERGCLQRGRDRFGSDASIGGRISARLWMKGCLEASTPGTHDLCESAPQPTAFTDMLKWQTSQCTGNDAALCGDLLQETIKYCASDKRTAKH